MDHLQTTPRSPQSGFPLIVSQRYSGRCRFRFSMLVVVAAAFPWSASSARGQIPKKDAAVSWLYMVPGTVADRYARTLENLGILPERSAAVRDGSEFWMLSAEEYRTPEGVSSGTPPWHGVYRTTPSNEKRWGLLPVRTQSSFNTAFPFHRGSGPVWHGKGFTQSLEGGWFGKWGP